MNQGTSMQKTEEGLSDGLVNFNVVNYRWIRKQNLPYVFIWVVYYAWVVAFATWWTASPLGENVFSTQMRGIMHSVNLLSSAVFIFIIRKEWFVKTARIGSLLVIAGMAIFFIIPDPRIQILSVILSSAAMGCVNISILIPFVFILNNTEKFYGVVGSNILIQLLSLFLEHNTHNSIELILFFLIHSASFGATLFFRRNDITENVDEGKINIPVFRKRIYFTILFNCSIAILCKGVGKGVLNITAVNSEVPVVTWYYMGSLIGCVMFIGVYAYLKRASLWLGNITFAGVAMGLFCNAFAIQIPGMAVAFALLLGIGNTVGMIHMYYIIGVVGKKYNSMRYLQLSILLIGICGGVSGVVIGNLISRIGTFEISIMASVVSVGVMTLFMATSPAIAGTQFENDWGNDTRNSEIDNEQLQIFLKYRMSKREIEVCKLLLQGYTMRQISGILSIAYPTVNTYCTSIYRKTKINSRTELLQVFKDYINQ